MTSLPLSGAVLLAWVLLVGDPAAYGTAHVFAPKQLQLKLSNPARRQGLPPCGRPAVQHAGAKPAAHAEKNSRAGKSKTDGKITAAALQSPPSQGCIKNLRAGSTPLPNGAK